MDDMASIENKHCEAEEFSDDEEDEKDEIDEEDDGAEGSDDDNECNEEDYGTEGSDDVDDSKEGEFRHSMIEVEADKASNQSFESYNSLLIEKQENIFLATHNPRVCNINRQ